jgi:hypothetical protein
VPRSLICTSNSRPFRQTPQSGRILSSRELSGELHPKSLFCNILPINPLDLIFCVELFLVALCFQYFANNKGRGYSRSNSLTVRPNGYLLGAAPLPSLILYIRNSLCVTGTLVYGLRFAKIATSGSPHQKIVATAQNPPTVSAYSNRGGCRVRTTNSGGEESCPDRVLNWDGLFQYSGQKRNSLAESLFVASGFGSPTGRGELLYSACGATGRAIREPSNSGNTTVLKQSRYNLARYAVPRIGT